MPKKPNIILIGIDSLRADHFKEIGRRYLALSDYSLGDFRSNRRRQLPI